MFNKFDLSMDFLRKIFDNSFSKMKENVLSDKSIHLEFLSNLNLKQFYSIGTNIDSSLIHGFKNKRINFNLNRKCNLSKCVSCDFITECSHVKINDMIFPFLNKSDCGSSGVIYLISCTKCNEHYIGETERSA